MAGGDDAGKIHIWSLPDGVEISAPWQGRLTVSSLAFGRNLQGVAEAEKKKKNQGCGWWLAAGDWGGNVTLWDVETGFLHIRCTPRGSRVDALAFSPDGTLMISGGFDHAGLWDVVSGVFLLDLKSNVDNSCAAFSPHGRRLAIATGSPRGGAYPKDTSQVFCWNVENGRGIQTLRGLATPISRVVFSPGGRYLAALATDWRIAIWDRHTGELKVVLESPEGSFTDNVALAFSLDDRRLAFSAGTSAVLRDVGSGRQLGAWSLPMGLGDFVALPAVGPPTLFRVETRSGERGPFREVPYDQDPRVCRIRELLDSGRVRTVAEIGSFNRHVFNDVAPTDLSFVVVDGVTIDAEGEHRSVVCFDGRTGKQLWSIPIQGGPKSGVFMRLDPTGQVLCFGQGDGGECDLLRMPAGTRIGSMKRPEALGPGADVWVSRDDRAGAKQATALVFRRGQDRPVLSLGTQAMTTTATGFRFSTDGRSLAWANSDGTIDIVDLADLERPMKVIQHKN